MSPSTHTTPTTGTLSGLNTVCAHLVLHFRYTYTILPHAHFMHHIACMLVAPLVTLMCDSTA